LFAEVLLIKVNIHVARVVALVTAPWNGTAHSHGR
jgi:hypothetical protein